MALPLRRAVSLPPCRVNSRHWKLDMKTQERGGESRLLKMWGKIRVFCPVAGLRQLQLSAEPWCKEHFSHWHVLQISPGVCSNHWEHQASADSPGRGSGCWWGDWCVVTPRAGWVAAADLPQSICTTPRLASGFCCDLWMLIDPRISAC